MANLDSRFICTSDLDTYYVDNATGQPMSGGIVTFYSDVNRTVLKPVYQLTGTPGNYSYSPLPNPCVLSSSGTFQDGVGNNIVPYYYPFTSTPGANTGVQELYYVTVVNSGLVPQFVRQGWPQEAGSNITPVADTEIENYIPNGQFLAHNNIVSITEPPVTSYTLGGVSVSSQAIAQGGWNFVYSQASTATFNNSFSTIPASGGWGINSFPRYIFNFNCTNIGNSPAYRDLRIQWPDVNKFSSGNPPGSIPFTLFFDAKSNDGNTYVFQLLQVYYYGTGGTPGTYVENPIGYITVGPSQTFKSQNIHNIIFPPNEGSIGTNNDDYVGLTIRGSNSGWNAAFSDFALVQGNETLLSFPLQTNDEMLSRGVTGWMPTPNPSGNDLYLPLILTPQGMTFDHSQVGEIVGNFTVPTSSGSVNYGMNNQIYCDGSMLVTANYSPIGIPFSRLQSVLYNSTYQVPIFGTGATFVTDYITAGATSTMILCTNTTGSQSNPADSGTTATGFTFNAKVNTGHATYNYRVYANINSAVVSAIAAFTNGTHSSNSFADGANPTGMSFVNYNEPASGKDYGAYFTALSASSLAAGAATPALYFTFSNHATDYYVWFKVSTETDPAPGGKTGIQVNLVSTMTAADVALVIANVLNGYQTNTITTVAASNPIPDQSWFTFNANGQQYAVWYQVNSSSAAPTIAGSPILIQTILAGTETAAQVATKTQAAINKYSYAVPDLRGLFLRGTDPNGQWDLDATLRWSSSNMLAGNLAGTFEYYQFTNHTHPGSTVSPGSLGTRGTYAGSGMVNAYTPDNVGTVPVTVSIAAEGGSETRPINAYVNYYIKY